MHPAAEAVVAELRGQGDPGVAEDRARFFQARPGGYAEGDVFAGVTVPEVRRIAREHRGIPLEAVGDLLANELHEARFAGVLAYVDAYRAAGDDAERGRVFAHYMAHTGRINNWDLVDASAEHVIGAHLDVVGTDVLARLAASDVLWERRMAMLATFHRIKRGEAEDALHVARLLLGDAHPLIHKAVGWMLREVGKRVDEKLLLAFLDEHAASMPATMSSYACERLTPAQRAFYRALRTAGGDAAG